MKFRRNKIFCTALLAGAIACGAMAAQTVFAVAEEPVADDTFAMMGASVRFNEPTGIRFGARLGVDAYDEPTDGAETGTSVSYGVAIFPVNLLEYCGIDYAEYNPNLDYVSLITGKGAEYFEYMKDQGKPVVYETESVPVPVYAEDDVGKTKPLYYEVYGSIGNVLYDNLARDFFGIAYQKTTTSEGDGVTVEYRYASFENGINVRSAAYVASAAYKDTSDKKDIELLKGFIGKAFCQKAGMTEEKADEAMASGGPEWTAELSQSSLQLYVGGGAKLSAQGVYKDVTGVYKDATIDLGASSWTSGNEAVASVDSTGAVKALKAGVAQITANVGGKTASCQVTVLERKPDAPYIVTVKGGTADKTNAAAGDTVTLTPDEAPAGKQFSHWTMDGERIEGDSFVMPARDVSVEAVYVTIPEYSTIFERSDGSENFKSKLSDDKKMFTLSVADHPNDQLHGATWASNVSIPYVETQNTISFTLRNNSSSHDLNLRIVVQNQGGNPIALSGATGGAVEDTKGQVKVNTIPQGESLRVSITTSEAEFDSWNKKVRIVLQPLAYQPCEYVGEIELSKILFGNAGSVQPESEYSVKVNGGFADKTNAAAGDKVTLTYDPNRIPEGMVFGHWTMNGKTIEGDSFEMPAEDVTVTAVYVNDIGTTTVGNLYVVRGSESFYSVSGNTVTIHTVSPSKDAGDNMGYKSVAFEIGNYDPTKAKYVRVTVTNNSDAQLGFMYKAVVGQEAGYGSDVSVNSGETVSWTDDARLGITGLTTAEIFFWGGTSEGTFTVTIEFSSTPFPTDAE